MAAIGPAVVAPIAATPTPRAHGAPIPRSDDHALAIAIIVSHDSTDGPAVGFTNAGADDTAYAGTKAAAHCRALADAQRCSIGLSDRYLLSNDKYEPNYFADTDLASHDDDEPIHLTNLGANTGAIACSDTDSYAFADSFTECCAVWIAVVATVAVVEAHFDSHAPSLAASEQSAERTTHKRAFRGPYGHPPTDHDANASADSDRGTDTESDASSIAGAIDVPDTSA